MRFSTKLLISFAVAGFFAFVCFSLPITEIASVVDFKLFTRHAKMSHFKRLKKSNQIIYLLGTTHEGQFDSSEYPYWQIRSVIEKLRPQLLLVEIRPESLEQGRWGEGPPEMPLAYAWAKELNVPVNGIDYWRPNEDSSEDFVHREDNMTKNILSNVRSSDVSLILTGFSHVVGIKRRLEEAGYQVDEDFESTMKNNLFTASSTKKIPNLYFEAVSREADLATAGKSDYPREWAARRNKLLEKIKLQSVTADSPLHF